MWDVDPVKTAHDLGIGPNDDFIKELREHVAEVEQRRARRAASLAAVAAAAAMAPTDRSESDEAAVHQIEEQQDESDGEDLTSEKVVLAMWDADPVKTAHDLGIGPNDDFIKELREHVAEVEQRRAGRVG
jgi:ribosomal protein L12E/L44/L45/RPP1/RPP2